MMRSKWLSGMPWHRRSFFSEWWTQTFYCWELEYTHSPDVGRGHHEMLKQVSPPDEMVKPEYRYKTECAVCKEHLPECDGGYNAAHWQLFGILHRHLAPPRTRRRGAYPSSHPELYPALKSWEKKHLIGEEGDNGGEQKSPNHAMGWENE